MCYAIPDQGGTFDLYVLVNDDGAAPLPISLPSFYAPECDYANNLDSLSIVCNLTPEISIEGNFLEILNNDLSPAAADGTDYGNVSLGNSNSQIFKIHNAGTSVLTLAPPVLVGGSNAADFTVSTQPSNLVNAGDSTTFTVQFSPGAIGLRTATITVQSDDSDEPNYVFGVQGNGVCDIPVAPTLTTSQDSLCFGGSTQISISGSLDNASQWYLYSGACGTSPIDSTMGTSLSVSPLSTTTYFVNGLGNCVTSSSCGQVTVTVLPEKTGTENSIICNEDSIVVNGTVYNAGNPNGTEIFAGIGPLGCDSTVTINLNVLPAITGSETSTICNEDSLIVNGTVYNVLNPSGTEVIASGASNGCDSTVIVNLSVQSSVDTSTTLNGSTIASNQAGAAYQWLDCDNGFSPITGATDSSYMATANGNYAVSVTIGSCSDTSSCVNIMGIGINELGAEEFVLIYPNPTNSLITVQSVNSRHMRSVTVTDFCGKQIYFANIESAQVEIDLSEHERGTYMLQIEYENHTVIRKVIRL